MSGSLIGQAVAVLTTGAVLSFVVAMATVRAQKRKILSEAAKTDAEAGRADAEAADRIKKSALDLVSEFEKDAKEARDEVRALRVGMRKLEGQLGEALAEGREALTELRRLKSAILDPQATVGALRDLVTRSSRNGTL